LGAAQQLSAAGKAAEKQLNASPALTLTEGPIGTAGYMSPEQIRGEELDARTDLFSFGLVLYEMATGDRAFNGDTAAGVHAAILNEIPKPVRELNRDVRISLARIIDKALVKDRGFRYQSAAEMISDLKKEGDAFRAAPEKPKARRTFWISSAIAAVILLATAVVWFGLRQPAKEGGLELRQITANSAEDPVWHPAISPNGKYLAYGDQAGIEIRLISTGESHVIPKPHGISPGDAWFPAAWFPDGTRLLATSITSTAVTAWTVSVIDGTSTALRDNAVVQSVSPDGSLIAFTLENHFGIGGAHSDTDEIWVVGPDGENARKVVAGDRTSCLGSVRWSPDGKRIAYLKWRPQRLYSDYSIETRQLSGGMPSMLLSTRETMPPGPEFSFPEDFWWLPDGRVIYSITGNQLRNRDSSLWQVKVDPRSGKLRGTPRQIASLAFHIQGFSLTGDATKLVAETNTSYSHILVGRLGAGGKLAETRRLTHVERFNSPWAWTSDSRSIIFSSDRNGTFGFYKQALDQNVPELIAGGLDQTVLARVSPDGASLIYETQSRNPSLVYRLMRVAFPRQVPQLIFEIGDHYLNFSCPNRPGTECVGAEPTPDGKQGRFFSFDPVSAHRKELFQLPLCNWVVSPDGSRIAMVGSGPIEIRSLAGKLLQRIEVKGWPNPQAVDWAADGQSVFVPHLGLIESPSSPIGSTILRVYLDGRVQPLWETRGSGTGAVASPDGKYVAIYEPASERNAWMIENF
jgi:Tol biopolymer transport system component